MSWRGQALREAVVAMVRLGVREARRGKHHTGDALDWQRLDYSGRRQAMEAALRKHKNKAGSPSGQQPGSGSSGRSQRKYRERETQ
jgi:hypothetical protein